MLSRKFICVVKSFPGGDHTENNTEIQTNMNSSHEVGITKSKNHDSENQITSFGEVFEIVKLFDDRPGHENQFLYDSESPPVES